MAPRGSALRQSGRLRREADIDSTEYDLSTVETATANDSPQVENMTTEQSNASEISMTQQIADSDTVIAGSSDVDQSTAQPIPATSPPAQRPGRLESLHSPSLSSTNRRSSLEDPSTPRPANLKFKPKSIIRRTKEEREAAERAEAERKQAEREAADGARGTITYRGRGRGRVLVSTIRDERLMGTGATGHLGAKVIDPSKARRGGRGGRGGSTASHDDVSATVRSSVGRDGRTERASAVKTERDKDGDVLMDTSKPKASKPCQPPKTETVTKRSGGGKGGGRSAAIKQEPQFPETSWSDEDELEKGEGRRIDIEQINISSGEEAEVEALDNSSSKGKERQKTPQQIQKVHKPVRLERREHKERAVGVNTDASTPTSAELRKRNQEGKAAQGSLFLDPEDLIAPTTKTKSRGKTRDVEFVRNERKWQGVYRDEEDDSDTAPHVKEEPPDDDLMVIDETPIASEPPKPKSPNAEATKAAEDVDMGDASSQTAQAHEEPAPETLDPKRRGPKSKGHRYPKPVLQTDEDHQEWARHTEDLQILSKTLRSLGGKIEPTTKTADDEGNVEMEDANDDEHTNLELYVFQFPPALPMLVDQKTKKIKAEPREQELGSTPIPTPIAASSKSKPEPAASKAKTLTKKSPKAPNLTELLAGPTEADTASLPPPTQTYTPVSALPPPGLFGQLRLHASKRTTANWGSLLFEIGRGSEENMAQEVVCCDWSKVVVKKEEWEGNGAEGVGAANRGDARTVKEEEREQWGEEIHCGEKVWGMDEVGRPGARAAFVGVPDFGGMFGV